MSCAGARRRGAIDLDSGGELTSEKAGVPGLVPQRHCAHSDVFTRLVVGALELCPYHLPANSF